MLYTNFENFLRNFTFSWLFLTMLFFWINTAFFPKIKTNRIAIFIIIISILLLTSFLIIRWVEAKHFPLSNLYESLIFLSWSLANLLLFLQLRTKDNFVGTLITPLILFINTFAFFSLPFEMQQVSSLVPALQSNWLMMHVTIMIISYAALMFGSLLSISFLVLFFIKNIEKQKSKQSFSENLMFSNLVENKNQIEEEFENKLDNLSYRMITFGFPLLTIGILSGAVWANETWGSYWSWDPKETWALITWFIYAIYLHTRFIRGRVGEKPALLSSFGFFVVWVCYLGVNIFGKGLHSYGWFTFS